MSFCRGLNLEIMYFDFVYQMAKKVRKIARKAQKPMNMEARKGEADRRVLDLKPKHLFSGKRGMGKTDRR